MTSRLDAMRYTLAVLSAITLLYPGVLFAVGGVSNPANVGASANLQCTDPKRVYTLTCDVEEKDKDGKKTGKLGGLGCPCEKTITSEVIVGTCSAYNICFAQTISSAPAGSGSGSSASQSQTDSSELKPGPYVTPAGLQPDSGSLKNPTPEVSGGTSLGSGVSNAYTSQGAQQGAAQAVSSGATGGSTGGTMGGATGASATAINNIAGGSGGYSGYMAPTAPPTSGGFTTSAGGGSGLGWSSLSQYIGGLGAQYPVMPAAPAYYPAYQGGTMQPNYPPQNVTFAQQSQAFYRPVNTYNGFSGIFSQASDSILAGIRSIYNSLSGVESSSVTGTNTTDASSSVFETTIGETDSVSISVSNSTEDPSTETAVEQMPGNASTEAKAAVQKVQNSLQALNATIATKQNASNASEEHSSSTPKEIKVNASTTALTSKISDEAVAAIKNAETRVTRLQQELEEGQSQLKKSDAKVQALTRELDALNQRIQTVNAAINDPEVSADERNDLIGSLITNIQLSMEGVEKSLEEATAQNEPRTIGEVVLEWTTQISTTISNAIQAFWQLIFSA